MEKENVDENWLNLRKKIDEPTPDQPSSLNQTIQKNSTQKDLASKPSEDKEKVYSNVQGSLGRKSKSSANKRRNSAHSIEE